MSCPTWNDNKYTPTVSVLMAIIFFSIAKIICTHGIWINLIGYMYKIISKTLTLRLKKVIEKMIGPEQYTYIKGRRILDGPLISNEVV